MNEELICSNKILSNRFNYYLVKSICDIEFVGKVLRYGIRINKYNKTNEVIDTKCICDLFDSKVKTIKVIKILSELHVTPITLEDIIVDNI